MMSPENFEMKMKELVDRHGSDREALHSDMDDLMCQVLKEHGYVAGVEIFENSDKWYS